MDARAFYCYLQQTRRQLWTTLRALPDEDLSRAVIPTQGARCIKDLVAHVAMVEGGWFRGDLLGQPLVMDTLGRAPRSEDESWHHQDEPLDSLLAFREAVEADTLARWPELMAVVAANGRVRAFGDRPETVSADEVIWHVMGHDVRHTAHEATVGEAARRDGPPPPFPDRR